MSLVLLRVRKVLCGGEIDQHMQIIHARHNLVLSNMLSNMEGTAWCLVSPAVPAAVGSS